MNKASRVDGIPAKLFQILKDDVWKCCTQYTSKFGKLSSGHSIGKVQFSFQSQRRKCQRILKLSHNCSQLYPLFPLGLVPRSLEIEYLSIKVEGARGGNNAVSVMGVRTAFFASQSAQLFPWIIWEIPFWCLWQWMTAMYSGFSAASMKCKISASYFIEKFLVLKSSLFFFR